MSPELSQLIELQELDIEIQRVSDRLLRIPGERDQTENEFNRQAAEFLDLKSKYQQAIENRNQLEADLATTQRNHEKFEQDKTRVTNEREYTAVLREIDSARKHITSLETEILKQMEEAERLEDELKLKTPDVERMRAEVDQSLAALDKEHQETIRLIDASKARRKNLGEAIPPDLFSTYDRMVRTRRGQALSAVNNDGICAACRMKVRPKVFSDVRRGDRLIICENCGRILYFRSERPQPVEAAATGQGASDQ
ncbi:MAG TPA: C4-type zinc ribbon domain-containing protein [Blastocatellia bacterium]|nr:C4-type zinc ribbon domain-containing protein [Blastocatellia bacterium]